MYLYVRLQQINFICICDGITWKYTAQAVDDTNDDDACMQKKNVRAIKKWEKPKIGSVHSPDVQNGSTEPKTYQNSNKFMRTQTYFDGLYLLRLKITENNT